MVRKYGFRFGDPSMWPILAGIAVLVLTLAGCGGGSSGMNNSQVPGGTVTPAGNSAMTVLMGDSPADSVAGFEITINNITLTDASNNSVTVLSTPTRIELTHNSANMEALASVKIPQGTYTKATITVSKPEVEIVTGSGQVVELSTTLSSTTATVPFNPPLNVGAMATALNFDFNLAASIVISGNTATITPLFDANPVTVAAQAEQDDESGEIEDMTGSVSNVAAPNFSITVDQSSQPMTFATNANTQFEGVAGLSSLQQGMIVQVDGSTQSDGTFLAKKVEVEEADADGLEAEGLVTSVANMPSSFNLVLQDESSPGPLAPSLGNLLTVNVSPSTQYKIQESNNIDLGGLMITPKFDATTLGPAQSVEGDSAASSITSINADTVKLKLQGISGSVSNFVTIDSSHASFTFTTASDSVFDSLSTQTTITVLTTGKTEMKGVSSISNGANLRVRGLLFFNGGAYTMVAGKVTTP